jgi:hypothetical protein
MLKERMLTGLMVAIAMAGGLPAAAEVNVAAMREALLLPEEPAGAIPLAEARKQLSIAPRPIVVIGRIEAKGMDPFLEGKASFSLLEIPADDHADKPGHKPDDCPFCKKRRANATMAAVQFLGADDKPIPVDARTLFGVDKGRDVVVRGTGVFDAKLGIPVIQLTADGLFVRPK